MIRVLAGEKKGMQLRVARTSAVRPTASSARQALFDILGPRVIGVRFLDLYAGSGAVGLEALSRGATECVMVESSHRCIETIRKNIEHLGYQDRCRVFAAPAERAIRKLAADGQPFDLIFLGPPYGGDEAKRCLQVLGEPATSLLSPAADSLVIAQISTHTEILRPCGHLILEREKKLGDTHLCFYRLAPEAERPPQETETP